MQIMKKEKKGMDFSSEIKYNNICSLITQNITLMRIGANGSTADSDSVVEVRVLYP